MASIKDTADAAALRIMDRIEIARAIHKDDIAHEVARAIREAQRQSHPDSAVPNGYAIGGVITAGALHVMAEKK